MSNTPKVSFIEQVRLLRANGEIKDYDCNGNLLIDKDYVGKSMDDIAKRMPSQNSTGETLKVQYTTPKSIVVSNDVVEIKSAQGASKVRVVDYNDCDSRSLQNPITYTTPKENLAMGTTKQVVAVDAVNMQSLADPDASPLSVAYNTTEETNASASTNTSANPQIVVDPTVKPSK